MEMSTQEELCRLQQSPAHGNAQAHSSPSNSDGESGAELDASTCPGLKAEDTAGPAEGNQPLSEFWLVMSELKLLHERIANEHLREISALRQASVACYDRGKQVLDEYAVPSERLAGDVHARDGIPTQFEEGHYPSQASSFSADCSSDWNHVDNDKHEASYIRARSVTRVGKLEDSQEGKYEDEHENKHEEKFQKHCSTRTLRSSGTWETASNFSMALKAQLRPTWEVAEALQVAIPRWSASSDQPDTDEEVDSELQQGPKPITSTETMRSTRVLRKTTRGFFHREDSLPLAYLVNQTRRSSYIIHPQSVFKVTFDLIGIAVMLYDFVMTPLKFFDLPDSLFLFWFELITRTFWVVDMFLNFITGRFIRGVLTMCWRKIAKDYLKGMFVFDLILIIADWSAVIIENTNSASLQGFAPIRMIKGLRFAKVIRVFKVERILLEIQAQINSTYLLLILRPVILILCLLFFNHLLACFWYALGKSSTHGWTAQVRDSSKASLYFTSLHWAIAQLHGNVDVFPANVQERIFQCSMTVIALLLFSTLLSSITNSMAQIHELRQEKFFLESQIREVLANRNVSAELTARIKNRLAYTGTTKMASDFKIISRLPKDLAIDLLSESRTTMVDQHDYFFLLGYRCPRVLRHLCHEAMEEEMCESKQLIFSAGDICLDMYFVVKGALKYTQADLTVFGATISIASREDSESSFLDDGSEILTRKCSICEPTLWLSWSYHGTMVPTSPAHLLTVNAQKFGEVVKQFHFAHVNSSRYAQTFLERMIEVGQYSDMAPPTDFCWGEEG